MSNPAGFADNNSRTALDGIENGALASISPSLCALFGRQVTANSELEACRTLRGSSNQVSQVVTARQNAEMALLAYRVQVAEDSIANIEQLLAKSLPTLSKDTSQDTPRQAAAASASKSLPNKRRGNKPKKTKRGHRCVLCTRTHKSVDCTVYSSYASRKARGVELDLCFKCAHPNKRVNGKNHRCSQTEIRCRYCRMIVQDMEQTHHSRIFCNLRSAAVSGERIVSDSEVKIEDTATSEDSGTSRSSANTN